MPPGVSERDGGGESSKTPRPTMRQRHRKKPHLARRITCDFFYPMLKYGVDCSDMSGVQTILTNALETLRDMCSPFVLKLAVAIVVLGAVPYYFLSMAQAQLGGN